MGVVRALVEVVEMSGASGLELLRAANIPPDALDASDARLTRAESYRLCELAMDLTRDPALGMHWAERLNAHSFTPISPLLEHAATLRQAFDSLSQFHRLLTDKPGFEIVEASDTVTVRCSKMLRESSRAQVFVSEMQVSGIFRLIRSFGVHAKKVQVQFAYSAPGHRAEYTRVFEGMERFDQPFTGLVFPRALMEASSPHKNEDVHGALRSVAERRMLRLTQRTTYAARVRDLLVERGPAASTDMKIIAKQLGMSVRSLRRRLSGEGRTYKSVTSDARAILAKRLLLSTHGTIKEVAYDLGFADTTAFHRAFKRRTGMTPQVYRTQQLMADHPE
jgi:AraC-like DNA-binding protein